MPRIVVKVKVFGRRPERRLFLPARAKVLDLLKRLGYNPQVVVVRRNGRVVVEEEGLASGDVVEIIPVVTGG